MNSQIFKTYTFVNSATFMSTIYDLSHDTASDVDHVSDLLWSISYQPIPLQITKSSTAAASNALGLNTATKPLVRKLTLFTHKAKLTPTVFLLTVTWSKAKDDSLIEDTVNAFFGKIDVAAGNANLRDPYIYLNYAYKDQDPISGYGAANLAKMQAISKKYDPTGLFQYNVPGGFKLFK
jgi:hypothetical protein